MDESRLRYTPTPGPGRNAAVDPDPGSPRRRLLLGAALVFVLLGIAYGIWWWLVAQHYQHTEDAYVHGDLVQITPQIAGTVIAIHADDTDYVEAGAALVELDRTDAEVALEQARATLAQTVRQVSTLYAQNEGLQADIEARKAQAQHAGTELARLQDDLRRRQSLARAGGISGEELLHAQAAVKNAQAALAAAEAAVTAAQAQLSSNTALTANTTVDNHPNVLVAAARLREAGLNLARTSLPAPVSGYVAKRTAQLGQRIAEGTPTMAVIPLERVWVDANFKEVQIGNMRIGQPVELHADMYGKKVTYHGKVAGLSAGTGSAFALLPPQNASGNWIKVVQRVPVRIALDPQQLRDHPLRLGLSMQVTVDISDTSGPALAGAAHPGSAYSTAAFDSANSHMADMIATIIAENRSPAGDAAGPRSMASGATTTPQDPAATSRKAEAGPAAPDKPDGSPRRVAANRNAS